MSKNQLNNANEYRGHFISEFAKLERAIDLYLATFFIKNGGTEINLLISILIDRIPFGDKRTALRTIFDIEHKQAMSENKRGKSAIYSKIIEETRKLAIIRNHFAHYHTVIPNHRTEAVVGLIQFRDSTNIITYTDEEFFKEIDKITKTKNAIHKLLSE